MSKSLTLTFFIFCFSFISGDGPKYRTIKNTSFVQGEVIEYKAHYGFINAAEGRMIISDELYNINGRPCYKIDVFGRSVGMFDLFLRIRDNWGTYLDTASIITHKFYRVIEEGKYRKNEIVDFDPEKNVAKVRSFDKKKQEWRVPEAFEVPDNVQDLVSGYYYIRTIDFDSLDNGDIIKIDAFFDKELYDFKVRFIGRETIKTKLGHIRSVVLSPIMPENSLFNGENSVKVWISDDRNKVPLKIKAEMFVGAVEIDITSYHKGQN
ncbi:ATP-dependent exoDNAse (exonuclease V) alpha subunit - helicase superfamily I member [Fulvivirga imtechensis AK7]|uniref:ATP-dependent exoDNAse (Exonuclease V) alpha subunit-helicase superfamily I member n=1 Tax=Fulvivirga imtechensis AK7 TaxID=1237149 RepID=L8JX66_9BACT|nr:DUF3108 domain-containing protein [Fulvivirga imtechensis]ELR72763.1 ATP-dependent exoDNAse (exonuclease V) alpha subunit - helicase superfamily I member [Fulvivirga imtechensis AK7]